MTNIKKESAPDTDPLADVTVPLDPHHGDLRKGAYLKRRAAYQMQASAPGATQAGGAAVKKRG